MFALILVTLFISTCSSNKHVINNCTFPDYDQGAADVVPLLSSLRDTEKNSPAGKKLYRNHSESTYIDYKRDFGPLHHLMNILSSPSSINGRTKNLTIVVFGGSQTTGNGINGPHIVKYPMNAPANFCNSSMSIPKVCEHSKKLVKPCIPCAFPRRFEYWLQNAYPDWNVTIYNLAVAGSNSGSILSELSFMLKAIPSPIDLAFVNYAGNDFANNNREADFVAATYEALLRSLMYRYHIQVVAMEMIAVPRFEPHEKVLAYYRVPTIRYDEASISITKAYHQHLPWPYHQLIANFLAYFWSTEARASCQAKASHNHHHSHEFRHDKRPKLMHRPPMPELVPLHPFISPECVHPLTGLRAESPLGDKEEWKHSLVHIISPSVTDTATITWRFGEDKTGTHKLGWYIDSLTGGAIKFTIKISNANPKVVIGYLQSYECRGVVRAFLEDDPTDFQLINSTGSSGVRTSQTYPHQLCLKNKLLCNTNNTLPIDSYTSNSEDNIKTSLISINDSVQESLRNVDRSQPSYVIANLTIELLPVDVSLQSTVCGNRFKILYVISC